MEETDGGARVETHEVSRRSFLRGTGMAMGGLGALVALGGCAPKTAGNGESSSAAATIERVIEELPIPETLAPERTMYACDVLVVGGGFAGLNAAMAAKDAGANVVLV